jgi:multicomponent Na+:H+ antiporter subunit D
MNNALAFLVIPFAAAVAIPFLSKFGRRVADVAAVLAGVLLVIMALSLVGLGDRVILFHRDGGHLAIDALSALFLLLINIVGAVCLLYSTRYIEHLGGRAKFYSLFLILILGLNGVVLVRDLFSLYVYLEVASIAAYVLVAFNLQSDGIESALKYLLLSVVGTGLIILALAFIYMSTGTLDFALLKTALAADGSNRLFLLAGAMFVTGFGLKAAIMPFHAWLPDAHPSAPAPVSAILSGVVIKVGGIYALIRIFMNIYPYSSQILDIFLILGVLSMAAGAILAYFQRDIKRMLAYSSISQVGYIMIGLGTGNLLGITGALFHIFNHGLFKSLLFLNSGALQFRLHTRDMDEMGGLESRMKVTNATSVFGTLSIAGVPPFNGFWSKLFIILGALAAHRYGVATIATIFSLFTLGYFLIIQRKVFFGKLNPKWKDIMEAPSAMCVSMIILAALCLFTGIFFKPLVANVIDPAARGLFRTPAVVATAPVAHMGGH